MRFVFFDIFSKIANTNSMMYIIGFLVGILNGLFASGAGQFLVFYFIYILKLETHKTRALSVSVISISSIFAIFGYSRFVVFDIKIILLLVIISVLAGIIGAKWMKKIPGNILNLISGILITVLTLYKIIQGG